MKPVWMTCIPESRYRCYWLFALKIYSVLDSDWQSLKQKDSIFESSAGKCLSCEFMDYEFFSRGLHAILIPEKTSYGIEFWLSIWYAKLDVILNHFHTNPIILWSIHLLVWTLNIILSLHILQFRFSAISKNLIRFHLTVQWNGFWIIKAFLYWEKWWKIANIQFLLLSTAKCYISRVKKNIEKNCC